MSSGLPAQLLHPTIHQRGRQDLYNRQRLNVKFDEQTLLSPDSEPPHRSDPEDSDGDGGVVDAPGGEEDGGR